MLPLPGYLGRTVSPDERRRAVLVVMGGLPVTAGARVEDDGLDAVRAELSRLIQAASHPTRTVAALDQPLAELARDLPAAPADDGLPVTAGASGDPRP